MMPERNQAKNLSPEIQVILDANRGKTGEVKPRPVCPSCQSEDGFTLNLSKGAYGCFRCGLRGGFNPDGNGNGNGGPALVRKEKRRGDARSAKDAENLWERLPAAPKDHPYCVAKGILPYGLRVTSNNSLVLELRDTKGKIWSLQYIPPEPRKDSKTGKKKWVKPLFEGGQKKSHFKRIEPDGGGDPGGPLLVCEGYATGASLFRSTGKAVVVAVDAGNLLPVARALRKAEPEREIIFASDNDRDKPQGEPGYDKGFKAANAAARALGNARVAMPETAGFDFNDLEQAKGADAVRAALAAAKPPADPRRPAHGKPAAPKISADNGGVCEPPPADIPYTVENGCLTSWRETDDGPVASTLCNFSARILTEETQDDGQNEPRVNYEIEVTTARGEVLRRVNVPSEKFSGMGWVSQLGNRAVVYAGHSKRDHARTAIQLLSNAKRKKVYRHTGWATLEDGQWGFLTGSGAITADGLREDVAVSAEACEDIRLPEPPQGKAERAAVRAALETLYIAPLEITVPLFAGAYRAPFTYLERPGTSVYLAGRRDSFKSALVAVYQNFFGTRFSDENLPEGWVSTVTALELKAFLAKDIFYTIDDFVLEGGFSESKEMDKKAARILRSARNNSPRARCTSESELHSGKYISRGLLVSTGEEVPRGHSIRTRALILPITAQSVDLDALTKSQQAARRGDLAAAMAGFLRWVAANRTEIETVFWETSAFLLDKARADLTGSSGKTSTATARLATAFSLWIQYAQDCGAVSADEGAALSTMAWESLLKTAQAQTGMQDDEDPITRFFAILADMLNSERFYLEIDKGEPPEQNPFKNPGPAEKLGWVNPRTDDLFLLGESTFQKVQQAATAQGAGIYLSNATFWRRVQEQGFIKSTNAGKGRYTLKKRFEGGRLSNVVHLPLSAVVGPAEDECFPDE